MKSSIKIDFDLNDKPVITIRCITTSDDLRDKALQSFLRKLGFSHAQHGQSGILKIEYSSWFGSENGDCGEEYSVSPMFQSPS